MKLPIIVCSAIILLLSPFAHAAALVIGGFDLTRGGIFSVSAGSELTSFRSTISTDHPGVTYTGTPTLTPAYLSTLSILLLCSPTTNGSAITPLTSAEQTAVLNFVLAGGEALIFADNDAYAGSPASSVANNSLLSPFGLHVTATLQNTVLATVSNPFASPLTSTPYGTVQTLQGLVVGQFDTLGSATGLANWSIGPALAFLPANALGAGSGPVVFLSDTNLLGNSLFTASDNRTLIRNAIGLVPEPSSAALLLSGALLCLRCRSLRTHERNG